MPLLVYIAVLGRIFTGDAQVHDFVTLTGAQRDLHPTSQSLHTTDGSAQSAAVTAITADSACH